MSIALHVSARFDSGSPRIVNRGTKLWAMPVSDKITVTDAQHLFNTHSIFLNNPGGSDPAINLFMAGLKETMQFSGDFSVGFSLYPLIAESYWGFQVFHCYPYSGPYNQGFSIYYGRQAPGYGDTLNITADLNASRLISDIPTTINGWNTYRIWREQGIISQSLNGVVMPTTIAFPDTINTNALGPLCATANSTYDRQIYGYVDEIFVDDSSADTAKNNLNSRISAGDERILGEPIAMNGRADFSSGPGIIDGYVKEKVGVASVGVSRRVTLHIQSSGKVVASTWSDANGYYKFTGLNMNMKFFAVCYDHVRNLRAETRDNLVPRLSAHP